MSTSRNANAILLNNKYLNELLLDGKLLATSSLMMMMVMWRSETTPPMALTRIIDKRWARAAFQWSSAACRVGDHVLAVSPSGLQSHCLKKFQARIALIILRTRGDRYRPQHRAKCFLKRDDNEWKTVMFTCIALFRSRKTSLQYNLDTSFVVSCLKRTNNVQLCRSVAVVRLRTCEWCNDRP